MTHNRLIRLALVMAMVVTGFLANAQILYKVEGNGLKAPSYLFGTHHLAPLSTIDKVEGTREAFNSAKAVVGEMDMTVDQMALAMRLQPYMIAPADSTLSKVIAPEDYARISEEFQTIAGMPLAVFEGMRPMVPSTMVALIMVQNDIPEFNPEEQLDTWFQKEGAQQGKKIVALETPEQQGQILYCTQSIAKQAKDLVDALDNPEKGVEQARKLNQSYDAQDVESLYALTKGEDSDPAFMEAVLVGRNADWMTKLPAIMEEQPSFVAVGALHLVGDKGLVNLLKSAGYTVTAVK